MEHILQLWTAPKCQEGAAALDPLPVTQSAQITEAFRQAESGSMVIPASYATSTGVAEGHVLWALLPLRPTPLEWVVLGVDDDGSDLVGLTLGPLRHLLALRGRVRVALTGSTQLEFTPGRKNAEALCAEFVFTNLAEDGLGWMVPGNFASTEKIQIPPFTAATRDDVLTAIEHATNCEFVLRPLAANAGYALDLVSEPNSERDLVLLETRGKANRIQRTRDLLKTGTVIMPLTADSEPMGEVDWLGATPIAASPSGYWIPLLDPDGGPLPIREDGQFTGRVLGLPDGTSLPILETRASDSAVRVASLGTYAANALVMLWEDDTGRPLATIESPSALLSSRGRIVAAARVASATSERNLLKNSGFQNGRAHWFDVNGVALSAEIARNELGVVVSGLTNGFRAAATGTGTLLGVDGIAPVNGQPAWIRQGDQLTVVGADRGVASDAVPSTLGALAITVDAPGLPGALPDGAELAFVNLEVRTLEVDLAQTTGGVSSTLRFRDVNTDGAFAIPYGAYLTDSTGPSPTYRITPVSFAYVAGYAGKLNASWGVADTTGTPPTSWTDGQAVTLVIPRGTRTLLLDGPHSAAAVALAFKAISAIKRYDITTADTLTAVVAFAETVVITAAVDNGDGSITCTINTATSTLDNVASGDRDNKAIVKILGSFTIDNGPFTAYSASICDFVLGSISGSTMTLYFDTSGGASLTIHSLTQSQTAPAAWEITDVITVSSGAVFGSNGRATVTVTIPSGRVIPRGSPVVWFQSGMGVRTVYVHTAVTGTGAGQSFTLAAWDPTLYRVFASGAYFAIPGEIMTAAASVQANGAGAASVQLTAANTNAVADNAAFTITRPALLEDTDREPGSVLRLFYAPGTASPTMLTPGVQSASFYVPRPGTLTARAWFAVTAGTLNPAGDAPRIALVNLTTNEVLATASIDATETFDDTPTAIPVSLTHVLLTPGLLALRVYGGSSAIFTRWHVLKEAVVFVGDDEDIPYFEGAGSRVAHHRGQDVLEVRKSGAIYRVVAIDTAYLQGRGTPLVKGQYVRLRDTSRSIDAVQRIQRLIWQWPGAHLVQLECAARTPRLTDVDVSI